jgi:hypothetical protein
MDLKSWIRIRVETIADPKHYWKERARSETLVERKSKNRNTIGKKQQEPKHYWKERSRFANFSFKNISNARA